ncbi:LysM peptidoglycan-binding domain-containing protein [Chryseolinea sp. T2]|uniref:LysM peptidoglycan-binding domain-containing protein n=1 Tax=Chryseolinea sp. T2 TaxID=3129255 RepID=UPI003076DD47
MINELIIAGATFFHPPVMLDSIGTETINGKIFVLHQVDEKETLYAISRRYGVPVETIVQYNPTASNGLDIGQVLKVPYTPHRASKNADVAGTHTVAAKETMFSISQAYGVSVDELKQWNNLTSNALSVGQTLIVKKPSGAQPVNAASNPSTTIKAPAGGVHIVAAKETIYSISRQYGISAQDLKDWNKIDGNEISIGQQLLVVAPKSNSNTSSAPTVATTTVSPTGTSATTGKPAAAVTTAAAGGASARKTDEVATGSESKSVTSDTRAQASTASASKPEPKEQTIRISETVKSSDEVLETGLAELIEGTDGNRKYLALHRTAPVGTILKVRNEMNNREVFVRVMGKLPDTALTNKLVIKISKSAYDRLGAIDPRFRVEVTYYK